MRFKKALALLLTCSIIVTEVPVFAAEKADSSENENILAAKEDVKVDGVLKGNAPIVTAGIADVSMLQTSTEYVIPIFETDK